MLTPEEQRTASTVVTMLNRLQADLAPQWHKLQTINSIIAAVEGLQTINAESKALYGDALRMAGEYRLIGLGNALDTHGFATLEEMRAALQLKLAFRGR